MSTPALRTDGNSRSGAVSWSGWFRNSDVSKESLQYASRSDGFGRWPTLASRHSYDTGRSRKSSRIPKCRLAGSGSHKTRNHRDELCLPKAKPCLYLGRSQPLGRPTRRARDLWRDAPLPMTYAKLAHQSVVLAAAVIRRFACPQRNPRQSQRSSRARVCAKNLCGEIRDCGKYITRTDQSCDLSSNGQIVFTNPNNSCVGVIVLKR